ncbi:MAG: hypothetical protein NUV82_03355 [Candidatus Komeilibacteria bacterium]|nr:hypothetical protein [Candidatus Komeilibacteria bacterium]
MIKKALARLRRIDFTLGTTRQKAVVFILLCLVVAITPLFAQAGFDLMEDVVNPVLKFILDFLGVVLVWLIGILLWAAKFNDFINMPGVVEGWKLVRDLCNMFFILILLIISVGTVLQIQSYSYKNFLKKVILMAILINFSRTIAGFLIDFSQIVMLTFISAIEVSLATGFLNVFGISRLEKQGTSIGASGEITDNSLEKGAGLLLGIVVAVVFMMVIISMIVMLIYRIVLLWVLVILSPLAYLGAATPGGLGGYTGQWWKQFTEQLIVGPALAFFLWLSLLMIDAGGDTGTIVTQAEISAISPNPDVRIDSALGNMEFMVNYLLAIVLLIVGMKMAQQMGGLSGGMASNVFNKLKTKGTGYLKKAGKTVGGGAAKMAGRTVRNTAEAATRGMLSGAPEGSRRAALGSLLKDRKKGRDEAKQKKWVSRLKKMGASDETFESLGKRYEKDPGYTATSSLGSPSTTTLGGAAAVAGAAIAGPVGLVAALPVAGARMIGAGMFGKNSNFRKGIEGELKNRDKAKKVAEIMGSGNVKRSDMVDRFGDVGEKSAKTILASQSYDKLNDELQSNKDIISGKKTGNKDAAKKNMEGMLIATKLGVDEGWATKDMSRLYNENSGTIVKDKKGKDVSLDSYKPEKSKEMYLNDTMATRGMNTEKYLNREIDQLVDTDTDVADETGQGGWKVTGSDKDNVTLGQGENSKTVTRQEFMSNNSQALADNFYGSSGYERALSDSGGEIMTPEEYAKAQAATPVNMEGVTMGPTARGGSTIAYSFSAAEEGMGRQLEGEQRRAGMHSRGESAVETARYLGGRISEQKEELSQAEDESSITSALQKFGLSVAPGMKLDKLQTLKQQTLAEADTAITTLSDEDNIRENGLNSVNKDKYTTDTRGIIRHEEAHQMIETMDADGVAQDKLWNNLPAQKQAAAAEKIRQSRNQPDMTDDEVKKEYFADALANTNKPGGPEVDKPVLTSGQVAYLDAGPEDLEGPQSESYMSSRIYRFKARREKKKAEKVQVKADKFAEKQWSDEGSAILAEKQQAKGSELTEEEKTATKADYMKEKTAGVKTKEDLQERRKMTEIASKTKAAEKDWVKDRVGILAAKKAQKGSDLTDEEKEKAKQEFIKDKITTRTEKMAAGAQAAVGGIKRGAQATMATAGKVAQKFGTEARQGRRDTKLEGKSDKFYTEYKNNQRLQAQWNAEATGSNVVAQNIKSGKANVTQLLGANGQAQIEAMLREQKPDASEEIIKQMAGMVKSKLKLDFNQQVRKGGRFDNAQAVVSLSDDGRDKQNRANKIKIQNEKLAREHEQEIAKHREKERPIPAADVKEEIKPSPAATVAAEAPGSEAPTGGVASQATESSTAREATDSAGASGMTVNDFSSVLQTINDSLDNSVKSMDESLKGTLQELKKSIDNLAARIAGIKQSAKDSGGTVSTLRPVAPITVSNILMKLKAIQAPNVSTAEREKMLAEISKLIKKLDDDIKKVSK